MGHIEVTVDFGERSELVAEVASISVHAYLLTVELATILGLEFVMHHAFALSKVVSKVLDAVSELTARPVDTETRLDVGLAKLGTREGCFTRATSEKLVIAKVSRWGVS